MEANSSGGGNRAEADRWLLIAEKLLAGRDLVGSKTFAIRARDSDPTRLDLADQILAVADTLIAGEKRLLNQQLDWYSILQMNHHHNAAADPSSHYRRLSLLLHPQRNHLPFADHAFKLVSDAWSVLSNPSRKALYDNDILLNNNNLNNNNDNDDSSNYSSANEHTRNQQQPVRRSSRNSNNSKTRARTVAQEIGNPSDNAGDNADDDRSESHDVHYNFWTACPYCLNMYEYPGVYVDCSLRCQNCRRAFHGTKIMAPPPIIEGKESYFCCWGFYPLGVSASKLDKNKGGDSGGSNWSPFTPIFGGGPRYGGERSNVVEDSVNVGVGQMNVNAHKSSAPRIYVNDDDDVYVEVSEPEEQLDDDWGSNKQKKKKAKGMEGKDLTGNKNVKKPASEKAKKLKGVNDGSQGGSLMPGNMGAPNVPNSENSRKVAGNSAKKQAGKFAKQWNRLDLNVEFSNEVEEPAPGMSRLNAPGMGRGNAMGMIRGNGVGNGEEEGMEGIGFFEGLDEFLSSLPILKS